MLMFLVWPVGCVSGLHIVVAFRFSSSFRPLVRPQKKKRRAERMVMQALVMTMAITARLERLLLLSFAFPAPGLDIVVLEDGLLGEGVSAGKGSPGLSMYVLL